jgi:hypothetical protein
VYCIQDFKKWWLEMELRKTAAHFIIHAGNNRKVNAEFIAEGRAGIR